MRIASIVSAAAMLALATAGSALAAEPFATLDGVSAQPMSSAELDSVQGEGALGGSLNIGDLSLSGEVTGLPDRLDGDGTVDGDGPGGTIGTPGGGGHTL